MVKWGRFPSPTRNACAFARSDKVNRLWVGVGALAGLREGVAGGGGVAARWSRYGHGTALCRHSCHPLPPLPTPERQAAQKVVHSADAAERVQVRERISRCRNRCRVESHAQVATCRHTAVCYGRSCNRFYRSLFCSMPFAGCVANLRCVCERMLHDSDPPLPSPPLPSPFAYSPHPHPPDRCWILYETAALSHLQM